jgi:hemerythrin-like domain-containing protein
MSATPTRPSRPAIDAPANFEVLDHTHQQVMKLLALMPALLAHVDDSGPDDEARRMAAEVRAFFDGQARQHHAEEEARVFPDLIASGDVELVRQVKRLQQDHRWLEEDWQVLGPQFEAIERGYNWYDLTMLRQALPVFEALNREHITLEEALVYPAARQHQRALNEGAAARRR